MAEFQSGGSGRVPPAADPETDRAPAGRASHSQRSLTPYTGCYRKERRRNQAQRALDDGIMARRRRQRRSLKESGDYLGVQGVNPLTGKPDHITPFSSDERSALSVDTKHGHIHIPRDFTPRNASGGGKLVGDIQGQNSGCPGEIKTVVSSPKHDKQEDRSQWPSVQEPNLSPVVQSSISGK